MSAISKYDDFGFGLSWTTDDSPPRTSNALIVDGRAWLIDPVDVGDALEQVAAKGEVAGVIQLLDRHNRDGEKIAKKLGVTLHILPDEIEGTPFQFISVVDRSKWKEKALWWPERKVLVVAETIGTIPFFAFGDDLAGMHPLVRFVPPQAIRGIEPEHLLCGHGLGLHGPDATAAVEQAYDHARSDIPRMLVSLPKAMLASS